MNCYQQKEELNSIFADGEEFWWPIAEGFHQMQLLYQGKLYQRHQKTRKWEVYHLELYADKLVRFIGSTIEQCKINACVLKKIKYSESSFQSYKHGFRLQYLKHKIEFFAETLDAYEKWCNILKRYCLLSKFNKRYKIISKLRINDFSGTTYNAMRCQDNLYFQIRVHDKSKTSQLEKQQILKEVSILRSIDNLYCQKFQEIYEDSQNLYIVLDQYAGRDLKYVVQQLLQSSERIIAEFMYKLLMAVNHIHTRGIFHRDIKFDHLYNRFPDNITDVCITNFSSSEFYEKKPNKRIGTPGFMAPEIFKTKQYDLKVDVYSAGVIFYYITFGRMPYGNDLNEILKNNESGIINYPETSRITISGIQLMKQMLEKDPELRSSSFNALNHHWFINMKVRELLGRPALVRPVSQANLSTIIEKSDFIDTSNLSIAITPNRQATRLAQSRSTDICLVEQEFILESLAEKMQNLSQFTKHPSRQTHNQ